MKATRLFVLIIGSILLMQVPARAQPSQSTVEIRVQKATPGSPVTFGLPFSKGELMSPDHVRVLNAKGEEIASQKTTVTTWVPADYSVKWLWIFFFADESDTYTVEYGKDVRQTVFTENPIYFKNNQRDNGFAEISTGPLKLRINKSDASGFIDRIYYNRNGNDFDEDDLIASGISGRGSFLDILDDAGLDTSKAVIHQHFIEKGSGPMHAIVRVEGEYIYEQEEHENSPFVTYIHAYAGKSYLKVYHTITYTGIPDKSEPLNGYQHPDIATQTEKILVESEREEDDGLVQPNDKIASMGLGLQYHLSGDLHIYSALENGSWWESGEPVVLEYEAAHENRFSVFQTGPDPARTVPVTVSGQDERPEGFTASFSSDTILEEAEKAEGWLSISDREKGVSIAIKNMVQEFPNELDIDLTNGFIYAYSWSPNEEPMSFQRYSTTPEAGMVGNFARGITKTSEFIFNFHDSADTAEQVRAQIFQLLEPAAARADANWYSASGVYGEFAGSGTEFTALERSLEYKYKWMLFNQKWEPWYGTFEYGDFKNYYFNNTWVQWANNEPAQDFQLWMHYIRTGDYSMYEAAKAMSRHTMDVDNTHWPRTANYRGDTNRSLDWFEYEENEHISLYTGIGRRHSAQQWTSKLSAHVWVPGWIASYYLDGYHRGLEVAKLTGDYYIRRIFGNHGLTGRRLYLSIWNLSELYDATKDEKYLDELNFRLDRMLALQKVQGGRINIDRYGYSQNYISHGISKVLQMFDRPELEQALVEHARQVLYNPPYDHDMESFLSSIHPLIVGYDITGNQQYLLEACKRSGYLMVDELPRPFENYQTQGELRDALESVSRLPQSGEGPSFRGRLPIWSYSNGLRIFGWTHAFNVAYTIDRLSQQRDLSGFQCVE